MASESGDVAPAVPGSPEPGTFDVGHALKHIKRLSFPRRVGTIQERRAARYILRELASLELVCWRERFAVPLLAREIGVRLVLAACVVAVLAAVRLGSTRPLTAMGCWVAASLLVNAPWWPPRRLRRGRTGRMTSGNLVGILPDEEGTEAPARVVFMAHYDTKSQALPTGVRVGLVVASVLLCGLQAALCLGAATGVPAPPGAFLPRAMSVVVLAILAILAANFTGNRSPGALDNASGLGALLELARTWRPRPGAPVEVCWVATGAEEVGLDGARHFLRRHEDWWREKPTLLINLDTIGTGDRLYLAGEDRALRLAEQSAARLGLPWARLRVLGAGMDHEPFAARGHAAVSLLGDVVGKSLVLHSPRDRVDLVERPALQRAGRLAGEIAWAWAERHRPENWEDDSPSYRADWETALEAAGS